MKKQNKNAFSLAEAMILLLLVSLSIAVGLPLITQKLPSTYWLGYFNTSNNLAAISFGKANSSISRIGIGTFNPQSKLHVMGNVAVRFTLSGAGSTDGYFNQIIKGHYSYNARRNFTNSILLGGDLSTKNNDGSITYANADKSVLIGATQTKNSTTGDNSISTANNSVIINSAYPTVEQPEGVVDINQSPKPIIYTSPNSITLSAKEIPTATTIKKPNILNIGNLLIIDKVSRYVTLNTSVSVKGEIITFACETPSDIRIKNIKKKYLKGINEITKINPVNFTYKRDETKEDQVGIIAQRIKNIFPEAIFKDKSNYYKYDKTPVFYAMINSVKDISNSQETIKSKQEKMDKDLDKMINKLKTDKGTKNEQK